MGGLLTDEACTEEAACKIGEIGRLHHLAKAAVGMMVDFLGICPSFGAICFENRRFGLVFDDGGKFPGKVDRVPESGIQTLTAGGDMDMGGFSGKENSPFAKPIGNSRRSMPPTGSARIIETCHGVDDRADLRLDFTDAGLGADAALGGPHRAEHAVKSFAIQGKQQ